MSTVDPVTPTEPTLVKRAIAEAIGTFILVLIGCGAAVALAPGADNVAGIAGTALAFGFGIAGAIYAVGHISGGHLNPAVSVALTVIGRFKAADLPAYIGAQLVGATVAALVLKGIFTDADLLGNNAVAEGVSNGSALLLEGVLTAVFLFVIVAVATDKRATPGIAALAIGLTLAAIHLVAITTTGTSVNPARTFGPDLITGEWSGFWVFLVGPFVGGALGALVYNVVRPDND
ncbi:MAG: MIP family channel protein [Patulibacter sp.]